MSFLVATPEGVAFAGAAAMSLCYLIRKVTGNAMPDGINNDTDQLSVSFLDAVPPANSTPDAAAAPDATLPAVPVVVDYALALAVLNALLTNTMQVAIVDWVTSGLTSTRVRMVGPKIRDGVGLFRHCLLDALVLKNRFDNQIAIAECIVVGRCCDQVKKRLFLFLG